MPAKAGPVSLALCCDLETYVPCRPDHPSILQQEEECRGEPTYFPRSLPLADRARRFIANSSPTVRFWLAL